jgi:hypothetical protein
MNLLIKKWKEFEVETRAGFGGKWMVEIINANGTIEKPFGDKLRNNLITNSGIDLAMGRTTNAPNYKTTAPIAYTIPNIIRQAAYGNNPTPAQVTDTDLTVSRVLTSDPDGNTVGAGDTSSAQDCTVEYDTAAGFARFTRVYDFPIVTGDTFINDIGIYSQNSSSARNLFSRMVLPFMITLTAGQFLRLTYVLQVNIPSLITPIPVTVTSGGFNGGGQFKLVGSYQNIFGTMSDRGVPTYTLLDSAHARMGGWLMNGSVNTANTNRTTAHMVPALVDFPAVNSPLNFTQVGTTINSSSAGMVFGSYGTGQGYQDITYFFNAGNPTPTSNIGGIIFCSVTSATEVLTNPKYGWYWKFNTTQEKDPNFILAINVRQSVVRL